MYSCMHLFLLPGSLKCKYWFDLNKYILCKTSFINKDESIYMKCLFCSGLACVCVCVSAAVIYSKASAWPFPDLFGHTVKIAQLGGHSITIVDAHLLQRFVCIQDGEINITFHATHCFFYALCPIASGPSRGREGGVAGVQFSPLKGYRHFEIRPGESHQDNETGQNSYCPIEINLNKKAGLVGCLYPHGAHRRVKKRVSLKTGSATAHYEGLCARLCASLS